MDVRIDTQRRGIVHPIPRPGDGQESVARAPFGAGRDSHPQAKPASGAPALPGAGSSGGETGAWFDANGDGVIESWSFAHGGDSFANFTPPPPRSTGPSGHRNPEAAPAAPSARVADRADASAGTTAAIHHAHTAYRRDGLSNAPTPRGSGDPHPAAAAPTSPAPPPPPVNVAAAPA